MSESAFTQFTELLEPSGPVAIVIKQVLVPANDGDPIIFPPSYPITTFKGRVHTINDGAYRVSVELPLDPKTPKNEKGADQTAGYNIDRFSDGSNSCEIDSAQSQANRMEPEFKKCGYRDLVPQIEIKVGKDTSKATTVNLLDAGHRAGDAVVRFLPRERIPQRIPGRKGREPFHFGNSRPDFVAFRRLGLPLDPSQGPAGTESVDPREEHPRVHPVGPVHSRDGLCRIRRRG